MRNSFFIVIFLLITFVISVDKSFGQCAENYHVNKIPKAIKREVRHSFKTRFAMTDSDKPFQETDVIYGRKLNERRLMFWSGCGEDFFLVYEHGGYAYHRHAIFFKIRNDSCFIVKNIGCGKSTNLEGIRKIFSEDDRVIFDHF